MQSHIIQFSIMTVFAAILIIALLLSGMMYLIDTLFPVREKRVRIRLLKRLSKLADQHQFRISSQEFFHETLIAFNGIDRNLMVICALPTGKFDEHLIDLRKVTQLSVQKQYHEQHFGDDHLQSVVLHVDFCENNPPLRIPLFSDAFAKKEIRIELRSKVCTWETLLNKMVAPIRM